MPPFVLYRIGTIDAEYWYGIERMDGYNESITGKGEHSMNILQTRNLTKYYGKEPLLVKALDGINMEIEQGSFTAIVGRSGSGKSTLLHMLGGLDCPTGGSVMVDGQELSGLDSNELTIFRRRKIGFVFQNFNLMPNLNIYDNIVLPVELDGRSADDKYLKEIVTVWVLRTN